MHPISDNDGSHATLHILSLGCANGPAWKQASVLVHEGGAYYPKGKKRAAPTPETAEFHTFFFKLIANRSTLYHFICSLHHTKFQICKEKIHNITEQPRDSWIWLCAGAIQRQTKITTHSYILRCLVAEFSRRRQDDCLDTLLSVELQHTTTGLEKIVI